MALAVIVLIWVFQLKKDIEITAKSNELATKAYITLPKDPTLAFRLAEQAYAIEPTPLASQVVLSAYGEMPFYDILGGHSKPITRAIFSPDGKYILSGSEDGTIKLWDNDHSLKMTYNNESPIRDSRYSLSFSPDGKYFVANSSDSTARIWDVNGKCIGVIKGNSKIQRVFFLPGKYAKFSNSRSNTKFPWVLVSANFEKVVSLWNFEGTKLYEFKINEDLGKYFEFKISPDWTKFLIGSEQQKNAFIYNFLGKRLNTLTGHSDGIREMAFSPDGNKILTGSKDKSAILWKIDGTIIRIFNGHSSDVWDVGFSKYGDYFFTTSFDKTAIVYDSAGNQLSVLRGHNGVVTNALFFINSDRIITSSQDGSARIWDLQGNQLIVLKGHKERVYLSGISLEDKQIITNSWDGTFRIWSINPSEIPIMNGHPGAVLHSLFSPDETWITSAGRDYKIRLWERNGRLKTILHGHQIAYISNLFTSDDGKFLISSGYDGTSRIWSNNGELISILSHPASARYSKISPLNKNVISFSLDKMYFWTLNGQEIWKLNGISYGYFSKSRNFIYVLGKDSTIRLINYEGKEINRKKLNWPIYFFRVSPNESFALTASRDSIIKIWEIGDLQNTSEFIKNPISIKQEGGINGIKWSPTGKYIMINTNNNKIHIWNNGGIKISEFTGHSETINDFNFSPDEKFIVSGSNDGSIKIWSLDGKIVQSINTHTAAVRKVTFSNDGKYILSCSDDQSVRLSPVSPQMAIDKINKEKVRGEVYKLSEQELKVYGIK